MKELNQYITEKLKVDKDVEVSKIKTIYDAYQFVIDYIKANKEHKETDITLAGTSLHIYVDQKLNYSYSQLCEFKNDIIDFINSNIGNGNKEIIAKTASYVERGGNKIEIYLSSLKK